MLIVVAPKTLHFLKLTSFLSDYYCSLSRNQEQLDNLQTKSELRANEGLLSDAKKEVSELRDHNSSLSQKCAAMCDYVKQLTVKCAEWESCYEEKEQAIMEMKDINEDGVSMINDLSN